VVVDEAVARRIAGLPYVRRVAAVGRLEATYDPPPADYGLTLTQNQGINAVAAHDSGYSAAGVVVGILDTGFRKDHVALAPLKRIAEWDFVQWDGETANQAGDYVYQWNHGTGVWSILGGYMPWGLIGPAFNASYVLAKIHDVTVSMYQDEDLWVAGSEWVDSIGVDIVQSSIAVYYFYEDLDGETTPMAQAANVLSRHGALVVCAMGNTGPDPGTLWSPADCDSILAVGSVNEFNVISSFSSRGPTYDGRGKPDLVAQGENTVWADAASQSGFGSYPGTSIAAPLVSAAAALVREAHPEWSGQDVRYALKTTADRASTPDSTTYGWGRPNIVQAIYGSGLGGPVYPKPFSLVAPGNGSTGVVSPVGLVWRRARDLNPGDAVSYAVELKRVSPEQVIYSATTADTFASYGGGLEPGAQYEWKVVATDLASHARACREPFRFTAGAGGPSIMAPADTTGSEGVPFVLTATAIDPDGGQVLTLSASGAPASLTFSHTPSVSPATATLSGTLTPADAATAPHSILWNVTAGAGGSANVTTTLYVSGVTGVPGPGGMTGRPRAVELGNRPNPFQASTQIEYRLAGRLEGARVSLRVYDVRGGLVRTLVEGAAREQGSVAWDGMTDGGKRARAGIYYYRLELGDSHLTRRLVLVP
jgi:hypothetical protein